VSELQYKFRVSRLQIGDLVGANYCKNSLRSGSAHLTNPAMHPPTGANLLTNNNSRTRSAIYVYHDQILLLLDRDNFMQYVLRSDYSQGRPVSSGIITDMARLQIGHMRRK